MMETSTETDDVRRTSFCRVTVVATSEAQLPFHHLCGTLVDGKVDEMAAFRNVMREVADGAFLCRLTMGWRCRAIDGVSVGGCRTLLVHVPWGLLRSRLRRMDLRLLDSLKHF